MPFMPGMFRSEEMTQCQLFLQSEASYACVAELGELGIVQFKDLNPDVNAFQRKFVSEVRRCEEMERKLRYIEKEVRKEKLRIPPLEDNPPSPPPKDMVDLEAQFEKVEGELREVNTNAEALKRNFLELTELKEVLLKSNQLFGAGGFVGEAHDHLMETDRGQGAIQLGFVAGVIPREKCFNFEKIMKRCTRNNSYFQSLPIEETLTDPATGDPIFKSVFIVFFQGEQLKNIVRKVCDGFKVSLYPCPEAQQEREEMLRGVATRLEDLKMVLSQTDDHRHRILVGAQKELRLWITKVEKIKAIYHTLNMFNFDMSHNSLIAECWTPLSSLDLLRTALKKGEKASGSHIPSVIHPMTSSEVPPTFFRTNSLTKGFQNIVDAYGMADYMEVNPAPYTIISFPFLFAVMFGDTGHGALMFLFGLWMIIMEKSLSKQKSDNEIWNTFFGGRYIITLMGLFSMYTGMIYNDCYSKSFNIFGSAWRTNYSEGTLHAGSLTLNPVEFFRNGTPYEFGVDPIWMAAKNKITFMNSFKMKTAIILGIVQMLFGICLSVFNNYHFRRPVDFFCEFLPEFIFLMSLFGYLVGLLYYKWVAFLPTQSACAPSLLIQYINMFMFKYSFNVPDPSCNPQVLFYSGQQMVQTVLVVLAGISAPWLLLIKPFVLRYQHKRKAKAMLYLGAQSTDALLPNEHHPEQSNGQPSKGQATATAGKSQADIELGPVDAEDEQPTSGKPEIEPAAQAEPKQGVESVLGSRGARASPSQGKTVPSVAFAKGRSTLEGPAGDGGVQLLNIRSPSNSQDAEQPSSSMDLSMSVNSETRVVLSHEGKEEEFEFSEIFIHQAIHTIEFCLGCISHTASYLRLWALSLAHAQLSEVLWNMVFRLALKMVPTLYVGALPIVVLWYGWAVLTIAVLLLMEGLSAFLHTLRLHWVEFQSKFYHGSGYSFDPYSFKEIMEMETLQD